MNAQYAPNNTTKTYNLAGMQITGEWLTLGEIAEFTLGKRANKTDGTVPIISSGAKPTGYTDTPSHPASTITLSRQGSVGNVYRWDVPIWADNCYVVIPKTGVNADFLYHCLKKEERILQTIHDGGLIAKMNIDSVKRLPFFFACHVRPVITCGHCKWLAATNAGTS